jgi:hypothetical protein
MRANGGISLELDGGQPEKDNETLWILKDHQTEETFLAKNLRFADRGSFSSLQREVKSLAIPVKGVISDGQRVSS